MSRKCNSFAIPAVLPRVPREPSILMCYSILPRESSAAHHGGACVRAKGPCRAVCFLHVLRASGTNLRYPQRAPPPAPRDHTSSSEVTGNTSSPSGRSSFTALTTSGSTPPKGAAPKSVVIRGESRLAVFSFSLLGGCVRAGILNYPLVPPS